MTAGSYFPCGQDIDCYGCTCCNHCDEKIWEVEQELKR